MLRAHLIGICIASAYFVGNFASAEVTKPISMKNKTWVINEVIRDGEKTIVGVVSPFPAEVERRAFPYRIMLVVEYDEEGSQRLPNEEEKKRFDGYEAAARTEFAKDLFGIPVLSMANDGIYQLVIYAKEGSLGETRLFSVLSQANNTPDSKALELIEFSSEYDPQWSYVSGMIEQ